LDYITLNLVEFTIGLNSNTPSLFSIVYKDSTQVQLQPAIHAAKTWDPHYHQNDFDSAKRLGGNDSCPGLSVSPGRPSKLRTKINDNIEAAKNFDYFINDYFINAVVNGEEDLNYLDTLQRHNKNSSDFIIHERWKNKTDFIGIDYYRRVYVNYSNILAFSSAKFFGSSIINNLHSQSHNQPHGILNDLGWQIYPGTPCITPRTISSLALR
jgi:hypothetical protein